MKKKLLLLLLAAALLLNAAASAAPALTDGQVTTWISPDNTLYFRTADQVIRWLNTPVDDLLSMDDTSVYLLDHSGRLLTLRRDGSACTVVSDAPDVPERGQYAEKRFSLLNGILTVGENRLSASAAAAACDGRYIYWAEKRDAGWYLGQTPFANDQADTAMALNGLEIPEPLSLCATPERLTLTAADHSVILFDPVTGARLTYPAVSDRTAAAACIDGKLLRYTLSETGAWVAESETVLEIPVVSPDPVTAPAGNQTPEPTQTPAPSAVPTVAPTATPRPTVTPKPTPTPTPADGRISYGATGSMVRKIQQRLVDLGYPAGRVDGIYGHDTQRALNLFMDAIHVKEHNYITLSVRRKLFSDSAPVYDPYLALKQGDSGLSVTLMQKRLQELGYDPVKIDGIYGANTVKAVAAFQDAVGFIISGDEVPGTKASRSLLKKLYSDDAPTRLVTVSGGVYQLGSNSATLIRPSSRSVKTLKIPASVKANGREYSVTAVAAGACKNLSSLEKLTIGSNIKKIGANAFSGCKKLTTIAVKTRNLTDARTGANIFSGVTTRAVVTCPEDLVKAYKKLFHARGLPRGVPFNP